MNHLFKRSFPLFLGLAVLLSACRMSPEPTITGPWTGTLTRDAQTVAKLNGNLDYAPEDQSLVRGSLTGLGESMSVSATTLIGPSHTGNFAATGATMSLNCTSTESINVSDYNGTCTLTKNGHITSGYTLALKRIY